MNLLTQLRAAAERAAHQSPAVNPTDVAVPPPAPIEGSEELKISSTSGEPPVPRPPSCGGCGGNWWEKMIAVGHGAFNVAKFAAQMALNDRASDEVQEMRKQKCEACPLFREVDLGVFSCGVPATQKLFRIQKEEGCGCWLNLKWVGVDQHCPKDPPEW